MTPQKRWALRHPERIKELNHLSNIRTRERKKLIISDWKSARGCEKCGEKRLCCLDAHHVDPSTKTRAKVSYRMIQFRDLTYAQIPVELAKCICLCANCHRAIHAEERSRDRN